MRRPFCWSAMTLLSLGIPTVLSAQMGLGAASRTTYGAVLGANVSSVSETFQVIKDFAGAVVNTKRRAGFSGGFFINRPLAGGVSLQPEAHYSQKGVTYDVRSLASPSTSARVALKVDYVEVPVLLRMDLGRKASHLHPFFYGGAGGAFRISCNFSTTVTTSTVSQACSENTTSTSKDPIEKYDVTAIGGGGLAISALGRSYALSGRYTQGLSKLSTDAAGASPKNTTFSVQLAIGF